VKVSTYITNIARMLISLVGSLVGWLVGWLVGDDSASYLLDLARLS